MKLSLNIILLFSAVVAFAVRVSATNLIWLDTAHDFGTIEEEGGDVAATFRFVNDGDENIYIAKTKTGCGCTRIDYPRGAVAPGDTATVTVFYRPLSRPGLFDRDISLTTVPGYDEHHLRIKGHVQAAPPTPLPEAKEPEKFVSPYPLVDYSSLTAQKLASAPKITLAADVIDIGPIPIKSETPVRFVVEVGNVGAGTLKLRGAYSEDKALKIKVRNKKIKPGGTGIIEVDYDPSQIPFALVRTDLHIVSNDPVNQDISLRIVARRN